MINQIEDGQGLGFTIQLNGKVETFRLVVIARKSWITNEYTDYRYGFQNYFNTLFASSLYSSSDKVFGCSSHNLQKIDKEWRKENKFISDNLTEINKLARRSKH